MNKDLIVGSLAVLAIAASVFSLLHKPAEKGEQSARELSKALGQRAAEEVAHRLGNNAKIAVLSVEVEPGQNPYLEAQMTVFNRALKKHGVKIAAAKALPGRMNTLMLGKGLSPKDYGELLEKAPGADAVVSFVGLPNLGLDDWQKFQAHRPPLIVVDAFGVVDRAALAAMVKAKAVALALLPRPALEKGKPPTQPKIVDDYYMILRAP